MNEGQVSSDLSYAYPAFSLLFVAVFDSTLGNGGAGRDRTGGLNVANVALSQLSYSPYQLFNIVRSYNENRKLSLRPLSLLNCPPQADPPGRKLQPLYNTLRQVQHFLDYKIISKYINSELVFDARYVNLQGGTCLNDSDYLNSTLIFKHS